jgi:hypothetical protein
MSRHRRPADLVHVAERRGGAMEAPGSEIRKKSPSPSLAIEATIQL